MRFAIVDTEWGAFGFVALNQRLLRTYLPQAKGRLKRILKQEWPEAVERPRLLPRFQRQVIDYFAGKPTRFTVDMDLSDHPPFRQAVLEKCRRIPYGKTASYGDLARAAGR